MIVVDASAVLAIMLFEEDAERFVAALAKNRGGVMSAVNYWEVLVRMEGLFGRTGVERAELFIEDTRIRVEPADRPSALAAASASARFKGRAGGRLNLGDCFAYALAMREGDGLLYKGDDFPRTDVRSVL